MHRGFGKVSMGLKRLPPDTAARAGMSGVAPRARVKPTDGGLAAMVVSGVGATTSIGAKEGFLPQVRVQGEPKDLINNDQGHNGVRTATRCAAELRRWSDMATMARTRARRGFSPHLRGGLVYRVKAKLYGRSSRHGAAEDGRDSRGMAALWSTFVPTRWRVV